MWVRQHSKIYQGIDKHKVWKVLVDVNGWAKWQDDLDYCQMEGEFQEGNHFYLKPKGGARVKIRLTQVKESHGFTDSTLFPGAKMYDTHELEETPEGLRILNKMTVTGPLAFLWIKLVAQGVADSIPAQCDALVSYASAFDE